MFSARLAIGALCVLTASAAVAAPATSPCVRPGANAVVAWTGNSGGAEVLRVYFRADDASAEHYVDMVAGEGSFVAALPRVATGTSRIDYRVAWKSGEVSKTLHQGSIPVSQSCAASNDAVAAKRLIVGTHADAPAVPAGFRCDGIAGTIDGAGELRPFSGCSEQLGAAPALSTGVAAQRAAAVSSTDKGRTVGSSGNNNKSHNNRGRKRGNPHYGHNHGDDEPCGGGTVSNSRPH